MTHKKILIQSYYNTPSTSLPPSWCVLCSLLLPVFFWPPTPLHLCRRQLSWKLLSTGMSFSRWVKIQRLPLKFLQMGHSTTMRCVMLLSEMLLQIIPVFCRLILRITSNFIALHSWKGWFHPNQARVVRQHERPSLARSSSRVGFWEASIECSVVHHGGCLRLGHFGRQGCVLLKSQFGREPCGSQCFQENRQIRGDAPKKNTCRERATAKLFGINRKHKNTKSVSLNGMYFIIIIIIILSTHSTHFPKHNQIHFPPNRHSTLLLGHQDIKSLKCKSGPSKITQ